VEEAVANLREATELYLEEFPLRVSGQPLVTTFQVSVDA
jgi:predicted RNase H-like HicB family nuclease